jgi:hypothetical protein
MADKKKQTHTSARRFRRESDRKSLTLVILTLVFVGGGLIALILGPQALLIGLPFLLGGAMLVLVPWLLLTGVEKWRDWMEQTDRETLR